MAKNTDFDEHLNLPQKSENFRLLLLFSAVTIWALPTGYYQVFNIFAPYDDEGYLMMTVKDFLTKHILYDEIYTQYGVVYYIYKWLIHSLTGFPVTPDFTRLTTLAVWILTAFLCGIFTYRLTRSALSGAASYILTFLILFRTAFEPGHPQELCGLLLVCNLLLLTGKNRGHGFDVSVGFLGVTLALLFLTKINLGIFLGLALAVAFLTLSAKNRFQRFILIGLTILAAALPFILFRNFLSLGWFRLSVLVAAALISALLTSLLKTAETIFSVRHYLIAAVSFCLTIIAVFLFVYFQNTTPEAFLYGVFIQHLKFGDNFFQAAPIQRFAHFWGIIAFAAALAILFFKKKFSRPATIAISILKFTFGVCIILTSFLDYARLLNIFALLSFATPFLWLLLLNSDVTENSKRIKFPQIVLVLAAILQPLQIFPIAGTQMNYASFLMLIVAVLCVFNASAELKILLPERFGKSRLQMVFVAVSILVFLFYSAFRTFDVYKISNSQVPLEFSGADRIKLPEEDFALYTFLVENLKSECDTFVSMPGLYSLHFWTQIDPPTTYNATAWMTLLNNEQQQTIIEKLKTYPRTCVVYHPQLTENGLRGQKLETIPLADYILKNYSEAGQVRNYRFMLKNGQKTQLIYAAHFSGDASNLIEFTLPAKQNPAITRIQLYNWQSKQVLADSQNNEISAFNRQNQSLNFPLDLNVNSTDEDGFRLKYSGDSTKLPENNNLLLRLLDSNGKQIALLPFLSN